MKRYRVTHTTRYHYTNAVALGHSKAFLTPRELPHQSVGRSTWHVIPEPAVFSHRIDFFGNKVSYFSLQQRHDRLHVGVESIVTVLNRPTLHADESVAWDSVQGLLRADLSPASLEALEFTFPSPLIRLGTEFREYALASFAPGRPVLAGALDLTKRIHSDFKYDPTATTVVTAVEEVLRIRKGVCQDFAHLQIACMRSLGIPARYVSGYLRTIPAPGKPRLIGADASHAWLSVYCPGTGWIDLDPTNNQLVSTDHLTLAWGRDFSDVSPLRGVILGGGSQTVDVSVDVAEVREVADDLPLPASIAARNRR